MDEIRPREPFDDDPELGGPSWDPPPDRGGFPLPLVAAILVAAVLLSGLVYWVFFRSQATPAPPLAPVAQSPSVAVPAAEPAVSLTAPEALPALALPGLDASDEVVRGLIAALSSRPELARWLVGEHLVRRFVAAVDNIAAGAHPRSHLPRSRWDSPFAVEEGTTGTVIAASSFARYDSLVGLFESVDPEGAARLYHQLRPLIQKAYLELGYPGREFDETLVVAIRHLLAAPTPPPRPAVEPKVTGYRWADPDLERLSPAQRQLLRTGPENVRRTQAHLRRIAVALGVPPDPL